MAASRVLLLHHSSTASVFGPRVLLCAKRTLAPSTIYEEERGMESALLDACGRRRSPATLPGYHSGRPPMNKGLRYPADPPSVEEIVAVMPGRSFKSGLTALTTTG